MKSVHSIVQVISLLFTFVIFPLVLLWVGYSHVGPLFGGEFTQQLGSIEVSYIQMAQFIEKSLPHFLWQPLWYLGYPMEVLYTPLVPFFEFFAHHLFTWSFSHAYRVLTAFSYAGALVTLYFFCRTLFKNSAAAFISSLSYGLLPSVMAFLNEGVASDRFLEKLIEPRRFTILVRWGEGPHIVALFFLPLSGLFLIKFLRGGNRWSLVFGACATALVFLTNSIGAWGFVLLSFTLLVGELVENFHLWKNLVLRFFSYVVLAYGLVAFWFNPLFLSSFFREGGGALGYWRNQFPWGWLLLLFILLIYCFICRKLVSKASGFTASLLFFLMMFGLVNAYYSSGFEKLELVPQVLRLTTEVDIGAVMVIGALVSIIGYIGLRKSYWLYLGMMGIALIISLILYLPRQLQFAKELPQYTQPLESTGRTLADTPEYQVAQKLAQKVSGGERVLAPGNYGFFLNYFVDVPQLRGALFQSSIHPWPDHIYYQMTNGKDADISLAWLKIANVGWVVFNGPREIFRDYKISSGKFLDIADLTETSWGDEYYKVKLTNNSLAKAVSTQLMDVKTPVNAIDKMPIFSYQDILDTQKNFLTIENPKNGSYKITGDVGEEEIVLVQYAYTPGWKAKDSLGRNLEVKKDPLGFIVVKPKNAGTVEIDLKLQRTWRTWVGWILTGLTFAVSLFILFSLRKPLFAVSPSVKKTSFDKDE